MLFQAASLAFIGWRLVPTAGKSAAALIKVLLMRWQPNGVLVLLWRLDMSYCSKSSSHSNTIAASNSASLTSLSNRALAHSASFISSTSSVEKIFGDVQPVSQSVNR